jgi:hypothetical protein
MEGHYEHYQAIVSTNRVMSDANIVNDCSCCNCYDEEFEQEVNSRHTIRVRLPFTVFIFDTRTRNKPYCKGNSEASLMKRAIMSSLARSQGVCLNYSISNRRSLEHLRIQMPFAISIGFEPIDVFGQSKQYYEHDTDECMIPTRIWSNTFNQRFNHYALIACF